MGRGQVFNLRAAENGRSSAALFAAFTVADCNVCSIWYRLFLYFY